MTKLKTLFVSTALGAFIAFPALAQVTSDTTDITAQVGITAVADGTSTVGTAAGHSITPVSEAYVGNAVLSSDGQRLGTISSAATQADGTTIILVDLDQEVGAMADNFQVMLAAGQEAQGDVLLIWSKAEILAALNAQLDAEGGSSTN
ncbi:hypothetical protein [Pseudotabrizicola algicola]|uniref:PRC-barrel domain-containing protein n=1 Tax=Pseudotabrizicola algicola TaxID=2709381 RepID=A0A6B3RP71_9RHOB|nr:hypothetical protein [Pseudotabrizicola algicola]NEX44889.1 hypothetical protein [Pseudotabrizicola algicola]